MKIRILLGLLVGSLITGKIFAAESGKGVKRQASEEAEKESSAKKIKLADFNSFYEACKNGDLQKVKELYVKVNINQLRIEADGSTITPLFIACQNGHEGVTRVLLESGKIENINTGLVRVDSSTITPLFAACISGHEKVVKILLESRYIKDINTGQVLAGSSTITPLFAACMSGHEKVVKILLESKYIKDINAGIVRVDGSTITPLFIACQNKHEGAVRALLESGQITDINAGMALADGSTITPLFIACQNGHEGVVRLLLKIKQVEIRNLFRNRTAYLIANPAIKELIKQYSAQEVKQCAVCMDVFKKDQPLHFSNCCQKVIHLHCALGVSQSGNNGCVHCRQPATPLNHFLYEGDIIDAATQTDSNNDEQVSDQVDQEVLDRAAAAASS
jgi:ankyrin repeat protein